MCVSNLIVTLSHKVLSLSLFSTVGPFFTELIDIHVTVTKFKATKHWSLDTFNLGFP